MQHNRRKPLAAKPSADAAMAMTAKCAARMVFLLLCLASGCSWPSSSGQKHLVFGFGIITTSTNQANVSTSPGTEASAEHIEATGLLAGPGPVVNGFMLGHTRRQTVTVPVNADLLIEAKSVKGKPLQVNISSPTNQLPNQTNTTTTKGR